MIFWWFGCPAPVIENDTVATDPSGDTAVEETQPETVAGSVQLRVTLDGLPAAGAIVSIGGDSKRWTTNAAGEVEVDVVWVPGFDVSLIASVPNARIVGTGVDVGAVAATISLISFDPMDNEAYRFLDPGSPDRDETTALCSHCHPSLVADWFDSPHRTSASNPAVQDLYAGTASLSDDACFAAGGSVDTGPLPGGGTGARCYVGAGVLPDLNACEGACDDALAYGGCADCHAPGIDGQLGGRDLHEATGVAYDSGVHCDVCHHIESVDVSHPAPGVAGKLHVVRPSEPAPVTTWAALAFGPYDDVPNPGMGSVFRPVFHEAALCAGCHEYDQPALVPGTTVDVGRWPSGTIPVHSTYNEWLAGPFAPTIPCQSCHMPPDPTVANSADLGDIADLDEGVAGGWKRPPGSVRAHSWIGPRQPESRMLELAATLTATTTVADGRLTTTVTTTNSGPGHALPTGEPLRSVVLYVEALCEGVALDPVGGDVVPEFGGARDVRLSSEDLDLWPGAKVGDVLRVLSRSGGWRDYDGVGRFGDGSFDAQEKGLIEESLVGERTIVAVNGDLVSLDRPLPEGDVVVRSDAGFPVAGYPVHFAAGAPGWAFARVLADSDGMKNVPHATAVDVVSDNRLKPGASFTTTHQFMSPCPTPTVHATLSHRGFPPQLVAEKGWTVSESILVELWK